MLHMSDIYIYIYFFFFLMNVWSYDKIKLIQNVLYISEY